MKTLLIDSVSETRKEPCNLSKEDTVLFEHEFNMVLKPVHLTSIQNVIILKDVVYKKFKFYERDCLVAKLSLKSKLKRLALFFSNKSESSKGVWIIDNWSTAYFHWFADAIPRLWVARKYLDRHHVLLPKEYEHIRYAIDSLQILNIEYSLFNPLKKVSVKNLLIPGHLAGTGHFNSQVMREIRDEFLKTTVKSRTFRRIFISRRKAKSRRILNEVDFEKLLGKFDFETLVIEDKSLLEQIQIFSETSILLGVHGAGLTNMLFMREGSKAIELRGEGDNFNNCYFSLASAMTLDYYYINCKTTDTCIQKADMIVDLQKMEKLLKQLILV